MRSTLAVFFFGLLATSARADVDAFGAKLPDTTRVTLAVSAPLPYTLAERSGSAGANSFVPAITFEARIHHAHHGVLLAVGGFPHAEPTLLVAGSPQVTYFDIAYSLLITSSRRLRGVTGASSLDVGPSLGVVGATLMFPDRTVQHAGVVIGFGAGQGLWIVQTTGCAA